MYIKAIDGVGYPYTFNDLRRDNPNTSFPPANEITNEQYADYDVYPAAVVQDPAHDPKTQRIETSATATEVQGAWLYTKTIVDKTQEEMDQELADWRAEAVCSNRQGRQALRQAGHYGQVKSYFAQLPQDEKDAKEIEWEYAENFERTSVLVSELGAHLGLSDTELDDLFVLALTL